MIKVFLIDDSISVRNGFKNILDNNKDIMILGEANNPIDAFSEFKKVGLPDVFILDIEMPKMDGLTFLKKINTQRPTPTIMCSTLLAKGSDALLEALSLGAFSIIEKPKTKVKDFLNEYKDNVIAQIKAASKAHIKYKKDNSKNIKIKKEITTKENLSHISSTKIIAIGSSTGGVQVLEEILTDLQPSHPAIVIVQHMPMGFTNSFAKRLNGLCKNSLIVEATDNNELKTNTIYIAPGDKHVEVVKEGFIYVIKLKDFPRVDFHKPSATVLLTSVSKIANSNAVGFILTGMGVDGAKGLLAMKNSGSQTYSQDEETSTVYGMPKAAVDLGASMKELSIVDITKTINKIK